ncbi:MAG TPA: ABC transporter permease subunit [Chthonomonadaceae bacterium]|nr:ABC transporter permease subunit [Chthonomonadaceae bacterium]
MTIVTRILPDNPVLTKELRVRMRGARAYWILFGYLGFLSAVLLSMYAAFEQAVTRAGAGSSEVSELSASILTAIVVTQMFLVLFITPAITSGSLTIEREQQTMDMLSMTPISRGSIVLGKLLSAVSFTALLLVSSLPLLSICFMLGSVDPEMVVSNYMMLLFGSVAIGAMGLMWSSVARTTTQAVMYTYATLFLLFLFGAIAYAAMLAGPSTAGSAVASMWRAVGTTWFLNRFLGLQGPNGLGLAIMSALAGLLMTAVAAVRLEIRPEDRARLLRGLTALVVGVQVLAVDLWWLQAWYRRGAQVVQVVVQPPLAVLFLTVIALMALVPAFATGEPQPEEIRRFGRYLAWGWTPNGLARGKMASGLPYLLLLTLLCLGLYALSFVFVGKAGDLFHSGAAGQTVTAPVASAPPAITAQGGQVTISGPAAGAPIAPAGPPASAGDFPQAALVLLVSVAGFSLFCFFLAVVFRNRWVAWLVASLFLALVWIVPLLSDPGGLNGARPSPSVYLCYFNPAIALLQMSDPSALPNSAGISIPGVPMWLATSALWIVTGAFSMLLIWLQLRRGNRSPSVVHLTETQ